MLNQKLPDLSEHTADSLYKTYKIRQGRSGKLRQIEEPIPELMQWQQAVLKAFEEDENIVFHPGCMAVKGKSILDNAQQHENCKYILRIDLKGCYQSIRWSHFTNALQTLKIQNPGDLPIHYLRGLLFYKSNTHDAMLPTGAPTSPFVCNVALTPLDHALDQLAKEYGYTYTRYIDDMHFSTKNDKRNWDLLTKATSLIESLGLKVNKKKSKWFTNNGSDYIVVTGVRIGQKKKVPRQLRRKVKAILFHHAAKQIPLSKEAQGYMAHIYSIDPATHESMMQKYLHLNESFKRQCTST